MQAFNWLLRSITQPTCIHDLLWHFVGALTPPPPEQEEEEDEGEKKKEPEPVQVSAKTHAGTKTQVIIKLNVMGSLGSVDGCLKFRPGSLFIDFVIVNCRSMKLHINLNIVILITYWSKKIVIEIIILRKQNVSEYVPRVGCEAQVTFLLNIWYSSYKS